MTWVFESSQSTGSDRLVLLAIADRANDEGRDAWPSVENIATKARMDVRTVQRSLRRLEALGELKLDRRRGSSTRYTVVMRPGARDLAAPRPPLPEGPPDPRQSVTPGNLPGWHPCHPTPGNLPGDPSSTSKNPETQTSEVRPAGSTLVEAKHRHHAQCGRVCVPETLHRELMRKLGGPRESADATLRAWYREVCAAWSTEPLVSQPIGDDDFKFWRTRFSEWQGTTATPGSRPTPRRPSQPSHGWTCPHDPPCRRTADCVVLALRDARELRAAQVDGGASADAHEEPAA